MKKKSILSIFDSVTMGGVQNRFLQFFQNEIWRSYDHYILSLNGNYVLLDDFEYDIKVIENFDYRKNHLWHNIKEFRKLYKSKKFDIIQTHNFSTFEAVIANTPQISRHIHNEDGFGKDEVIKLNFKRNILRNIFLRGKKLIVPSQNLANIARGNWHIKDYEYIPNGIFDYCGGDGVRKNNRLPQKVARSVENKVFRVPKRSVHGVHEYRNAEKPQFADQLVDFLGRSNSLILGTVCILRPEKNLFRFINFIKLLLDNNFDILGVIIGDGVQKQELINYAKSLGIADKIDFKGFQNPIQPFMMDLDIFVLTSDTEQLPYTILEAMNLSKPIISMNVGDIYNMVSTKNQDFIDCDIFANQIISDKLRHLLSDQDLRLDIGVENRIKQQELFTFDKMMGRRLDILNN